MPPPLRIWQGECGVSRFQRRRSGVEAHLVEVACLTGWLCDRKGIGMNDRSWHSLDWKLAVLLCAMVTGCSDDSTSASVVCEQGLSLCGHACCAGVCCDGVCADVTQDAGNCGGCGVSCQSGEFCVDSSCTTEAALCGSGQKWCGECRDVSTDNRHCGACDNACGTGESCVDGECVGACATGYSRCGGDCVDLRRDGEHCGNCETSCTGNMVCASGICVCPSGRSDCDGDASNGCETAASTCPTAEACEPGSLACGQMCCSLTCCGTTCLDISSDALHCGDCQTRCLDTQKCESGACVDVEVTCEDERLSACFGECVDLQSDTVHCGTCGTACDTGLVCQDGTCVKPSQKIECDDGFMACFGTCIDVQNDVRHCGSCYESCGEQEICQDGVCRRLCTDGEALCGTTCVDFSADVHHCGSCTTSCASGERCADGICMCEEGKYDCDGDLSNGCESSEACACEPGSERACWRGDAENRGKGICRDGKQVCDESGRYWGPCLGGVYPTTLSCDAYGNLNGLDNDCNGEIDTICRSECDLKAGDLSYIGCEYWSVYLYNLITTNQTLVFSNPSLTDSATIYIFDKPGFENASQQPKFELTVAPNSLVKQEINTGTTNMCSGTGVLQNAYRIRSTSPITAYQFNPWEHATAHSNDASLLLPALALGKEYIGMTWHSETGTEHTSYLTMVATEPGKTEVTVKTTSPVVAGKNVTAMKAGDERTFTLDRFEVLTLNAPAQVVEQTGTTIRADKNIAVFGGSRASYVPANAGCCRDHIEEQLFPLQSWGKSYYAARAFSVGKGNDFWRVLAQQDNTTVTLPADFDASVTVDGKAVELNSGKFVLNAAQFASFNTRMNFEIHADKPISVGQFLPSQNYNGRTIGDPSFILTVPYEQYRSDYAFLVPPSYDENFVTIIAPADANLTLDGKALDISGYAPIGETGFVVGYPSLKDGTHRMIGDKPFGLYNYGYFNMSSYGYPIGLDLKVINTN